MEQKKMVNILNFSFFAICLIIFLKSIKANIHISHFTYEVKTFSVHAEQFETPYIAILKIDEDGIGTPNFELSDSYVIYDDNGINDCTLPSPYLGKVIAKIQDGKKFLFVQKQDAHIFIKDQSNKCSLISPIEKSLHIPQTIKQNNEEIKVGELTDCSDDNIDKFKYYFGLFDDFFISEDEKCETVLKSSFVKNIDVSNCVGIIGHVTKFHELNDGTYYTCFKNNNISLLLSTFVVDKKIIHTTFYCNFENPSCSVTINAILFQNVSNITDETLVLKTNCSDATNPILKNDYILDGEYYTFHFPNNNSTHYNEVCILDNLKYKGVGTIIFLQTYKPIICFIGSECVIKIFTDKEKIKYIIDNVESTTFTWSYNTCDNKTLENEEITTHLKQQDDYLYLISDNPLVKENNLCLKKKEKYDLLLSIELTVNPQYKIYYSLINYVIINHMVHTFEYHNYSGPYLKYECSHKATALNEYNSLKDNNDNEFIFKNEKLNFNIDFNATTMRLCLKQINYFDIGSVRIEQIINFNVNSLDPIRFSAIISLYNKDINTKLLKFAIKDNESCHSNKGFFLKTNNDFPKESFYKDIIIDAEAEYEVENVINLNKHRYYICMCSLEEKCNESNNLDDYNSYTNINIDNYITPLEKKKYVCKLFYICAFTIKFPSQIVSDMWISKIGTSCNTYEFADVEIHYKKNNEISDEASNVTAIDFTISYKLSQMNIKLLNRDISICGNYKEQKFIFFMETDFFIIYNNIPNTIFDVINIGYEKLCNDRKTLYIYSYYNGETNLYKKIEIDKNNNTPKIQLNLEYDHLKYNKVYFIKECHYCKHVLTHNPEQDTHIFQDAPMTSEVRREKRATQYNNNHFAPEEIINIYNCSNQILDNHAITSAILFDGPNKEVNFYCYIGSDCSYKGQFTLLWYHYSIYAEITKTKRLTILYEEIPKNKNNKSEIFSGIRNSSITLKLSGHNMYEIKPGPYKIIYSRKILGIFRENYIGILHYIGASQQLNQIVNLNETEITLDGYFKNIEHSKIKVIRYPTCDFLSVLYKNNEYAESVANKLKREAKDESKKEGKIEENEEKEGKIMKIYNTLRTEVLKNTQECLESSDFKLTCKNMKPINTKFSLCWCYEKIPGFCNFLENMEYLITEISSLEYSIKPIVPITKPPSNVFMNYRNKEQFFLLEDDCSNIKNFHLKSQLNEEGHILNLFKELEFPKKYNLCICEITENDACDNEKQFKPMVIKIDDDEYNKILLDDLSKYNTKIWPVKDFNFSSEFLKGLKTGIMQAMVFLPGSKEYKEYICFSGIPCNTFIKMQNVVDKEKMHTKKERKIREQRIHNQKEIDASKKGDEKKDTLENKTYFRIHSNTVEEDIEKIYITLSDTKECKNEYGEIYESERGNIVLIQEIEYSNQQIIDVLYDFKIDFVPPDITRTYEICAFHRRTDKFYYNVGSVMFYGMFNENKNKEIISGDPFTLELKQFYSKYNIFIRFIYEKYEDSNECRKNDTYSERVFLSDTVQQLLTSHTQEEIEDNIIRYEWKNLLIILDADNYSYLFTHRNKDISHNIYVCTCYELIEGNCSTTDLYYTKAMKIKVHTAVLIEPKINSTIHFMKRFILKLQTSKVLKGAIRIFPIDLMEDLSKLCLEINQRKIFLTFYPRVNEYEQYYDVLINFPSQGIVVCWCSKDICDDNDYLTKVGFFKLSSPSVLEVNTDINGNFSFSYLNEWININDRIRFVADYSSCSDDKNVNLFDNTIQINNINYNNDWEQSIEMYGKPREIIKEINDSFTWVSQNYRIINIQEKHIKICYCFYYTNGNCQDTRSYTYIGLVHNNTLNKRITQNKNQIDQTSNLHSLNGNSIKFVAMNSYNDNIKDICNTQNNQNLTLIPFFQNSAFIYASFKSKVLNIFKEHYKNEINFVVCYSSYFYTFKSTYLLRIIDYNELSHTSNPLNHNYVLRHTGFTFNSHQKKEGSGVNMNKLRALLLSYVNIKPRRDIFFNYFFEEMKFKHHDMSITDINDNNKDYNSEDENEMNNDNSNNKKKGNISKQLRKKLIIALSVSNKSPRANSREIMHYKQKSGITINFILENIIFTEDTSIVLCCYNGNYVEAFLMDGKNYYINKDDKLNILHNVLKVYHPNLDQDIKRQNLIIEQFTNLYEEFRKYNYIMVENSNDVGFYKNHTLIQLKNSSFKLKIYGKNIPDHEYTLYIVEFNNNCYKLDVNLHYIENNEFTIKHKYIIFKQIVINKMNNYKLCIMDKSQNIYYDVGILNITNYYVVLESFFDENIIFSNLEKMNIILNVCASNKSHDAYVIKRNGSFKITLDMEKLAFSEKSEELGKIFPEIQNHQLISCKIKEHGTIILTKMHIFFYTSDNNLSFTTNHNLLIPVDIDFDEQYIYITDLHLRKIARLQILSNGIPHNIIHKGKKKRSIHNKHLKSYQHNMGIFKKTTISKNMQHDNPASHRNVYTTYATQNTNRGSNYSEESKTIENTLQMNKGTFKNDAIMLKNANKRNYNHMNQDIHRNFLNLRMLRKDIRNEKNKTSSLQKSEKSNPPNKDLRGEQIILDVNPNDNVGDGSAISPKPITNKGNNTLSKNLRELYNYLQTKISNNSLTKHLHKILGREKISRKKSFIYTFLDFFKKEKKIIQSSYNTNEKYQQIMPSNTPEETNKQENQSVEKNFITVEQPSRNVRKKRNVPINIDQLIYDNIIQKNIKKFLNPVQTPNYLSNEINYIDMKNLKTPLFISIQDNLLYILDSTRNNFFSYNLQSKEITELEDYNASSHKFILKNPLNFYIYHGEQTGHTTHRTNIAFVTQIKSNEIKIIDLNKKKYKIVKAIQLRKGYKNNGINKVIAIDQNLLIVTSQVYKGNIIYHYHFNSFDHYFRMSFDYIFAENYNSNDILNIEPQIGIYSDSVIFFCFLNSDNKCTNVDELTKLNISYETGIITGKLNYFGVFQLKIFAKTHFQHQIKIYKDLFSYCDVGKQFNVENKACESCPIGTFWDNVELKCEKCEKYFKNTSTLKSGSKLITDCLCSSGYEFSEKTASCEQCKPGYYKKSTGNFICIKGCPINRNSIVYGAKSYDEMSCTCNEGYFESNNKCLLCRKDYYCPGNGVIIQCNKYEISKEGAKSKNECICKENFIFDEKNKTCIYVSFIGKVKGDVIYCSLYDPIYLDTNIFAIPNNHNYGLVDTVYNYDEDLLLKENTFQYAYFDKNNSDHDNTKIKILNINNEQIQRNNDNNRNREIFAIEVDIPKPTKCKLCESGYYLDNKREKCIPCSNKYCEGFDQNQKGCPKNSIVNRKKASSIFDCQCKSGYGSINQRRNKYSNKLSCKICPKNFFKHNISEELCLPCPHNTYTESEGSTSIQNCLPLEGYFLLMFRTINIEYVRYKFDINSENRIYSYFKDNVKSLDDDVYQLFLDQNFNELFHNLDNNHGKNTHTGHRNGNKNDQVEVQPNGINAEKNKYNLKNLQNLDFLKRTSLFSIFIVLLKNIEEHYNWESDKMLNVTCHVNLHLKNNPNYTISYKPNLQSCVHTCKTNIYCTGVEFSRKNVAYTQIFLKNNQKKIVGYFKCKHYFFEDIYDYTSHLDHFLDENIEKSVPSKIPSEYINFILRNKKNTIFTCSINRDSKYLLYKKYQVLGCFMEKFCPGNHTPYLITCPPNSKTEVVLATGVDKCLCLKGYSYAGIVTHRCSVCDRGTYKNSTGNFKCENCPLTFSTANIGSTSINDCSCTPGNYLDFDTLQNFINSEKINYKNIIEKYFIVPKKKENNIYYTTEIIKISLNTLSKEEVIEGNNQTLKRYIAVCKPCSLDNHYCEGGIKSNLILNNKLVEGQFHTLPKKCPKELVIPKGIKQRNSINNCLCIHGKVLRASKDKKVKCFPCPPNTFKESEYDNSCSGVCPHFSTTFVGSSYENQCFCKNNYFLVTSEDENENSTNSKTPKNNKHIKSCKMCPKGAVCNRGFNIHLFLTLLKNRAYNDISILDHENPYPISGHYAVYKEKNLDNDWSPLDDNNELKYSYPYYNLLLFIQKNIEKKNYFFFDKSQDLYLNMEFIEKINKKNVNKEISNEVDKEETHNLLFLQTNAITFLQNVQNEQNNDKRGKNSNESDTNNYAKNIYFYLKKMLSISSPTKPHGSPTHAFLQSNEKTLSVEEMFNKYINEANELRKKNKKFERLPDIHQCTLPDRCLGTITNLCQKGSTGYQCNNCEKGYDMHYFKSKCHRCSVLFYDILYIILLKLVYYIIIIIIVSLNYNSSLNIFYISGILMKIWFNCSFTLIAYGFFSPTINSFITKYWYIYKILFLFHLKMFSFYMRIGCFVHYYDSDMHYNEIWYLQKYMNIFMPLFDAIFITLIMFLIIHLYKTWHKKEIQKFEYMLCTIPEMKEKYKLECLTDEQNDKPVLKKGKKKKIYICNNVKEEDEESCNHSTVTHDIEKNCMDDSENIEEKNNKLEISNENTIGFMKRKKNKIFFKDDISKHVQSEPIENSDGYNKNKEYSKYELKHVKSDNQMYSTYLNETIETIYNKKMFGPWRFINKRNEKLRKRLFLFLNDTFPCYILIIALSTPYVLMEVIQLFFCKPVKYKSQESELYLAYLTTQKCTIASHSFLIGLIIFFLVLFFYAGFCVILLSLYSKRNKYRLFDILLSNLLVGYRQGMEIFEFIFILKNFILVLLITFNIQYHFYYIILVTLILTTFSILEIYSNPFDGRSFNILNRSLRFGSTLNIFISLTIWGSFYWNYEKFFLLPILVILFYHFYMLYNIIREIILSRYFMNTENPINIKTTGYGENNIKHTNYKLYYKVMHKIKFFLNKSQKKTISMFSENKTSPNYANRQSKENIKFESIDNIIKRYNINFNTDLRKEHNIKYNAEGKKKEKEIFCIKKNHLPRNINNVALIWYDEQNEDLLFQMPYENKFCLDLNGDISKSKKRKFFNIFPNYARDKRRTKNIKYFVSAIIQVIDKFLGASKVGSIYENWFDFSMRFAFVYISWIKKINKTNKILPHTMDQLRMNIDQYIFIPLFHKYELIKHGEGKFNASKNNEPIEMIEKKHSFENTEIKISRSYGSYNHMGTLKNRKHTEENNNNAKYDNCTDDLISEKDLDSLNLTTNDNNETRRNSEENEPLDVLSYLKKKEKKKKKKKKAKEKLNKKIAKMDKPDISEHINQKDNSSNFENIFNNRSIDIFTSEMFNESTFNMLISLSELYVAMKTLKLMDIRIFTKIYQLYNEKFIKFEKSITYYINKLRDEIKLEIEEIDNEIKTGDTTEKIRIKNYYFYKEELNKRKKLEQELMCKIECLEQCIEANKRSQVIRDMLKNSRNHMQNVGNVDSDINYVFSLLYNEGTYKLDHSKTKEQNE
ncbi:hypothetical protein, conserved [Plasmodium gonderi]|uniref:Cysteine repeat modular protein 4 n=1 Tax=Plasmodium gonderi TaxID=77519 RepID=A0A1Y1JNA6_PLAGO|nr:hypothetical protein, conserved [Plasmodium gonderi]GAW82717.1 hypothetical protein, conserved [Plasmodium gonderi]